jgi:leader peptidase (prepilin peptidase) / N-methyltransferase
LDWGLFLMEPGMTATILAGLAGLAVGGLLNVVITRLPEEGGFWRGPCRCSRCRGPLPWYNLIPLAGLARRRCPSCGAPLPLRYPAVDAAATLLAMALWLRFPWSPLLWLYGPFAAALLVLTVLDLEYLWLPDVITLPGLALGLAAAAIFPPLNFPKALLGAIAGWAFFQIVRWIYEKATRGARQGVGMGDVKLLAFIGAVLGVQALPWVLVSGGVLGGLAGLVMLLRRDQGRLAQLPYGPFLAAGALSFLFFRI